MLLTNFFSEFNASLMIDNKDIFFCQLQGSNEKTMCLLIVVKTFNGRKNMNTKELSTIKKMLSDSKCSYSSRDMPNRNNYDIYTSISIFSTTFDKNNDVIGLIKSGNFFPENIHLEEYILF
jgi:hypothetical protein